MTSDPALEQALLAAHAAEDEMALVGLYAQAAEAAQRTGETDAAAFYLTHAYVFALSTGHAAAGDLNRQLAALGRDELQCDLLP